MRCANQIMKVFGLTLLLFTDSAGAVATYWPPAKNHDWETIDTRDKPAYKELYDYAFPAGEQFNDKEKKGMRTDAVLVLKGGKIIFEEYKNGYESHPHMLWSVSKTFANAAYALAVKDGLANLDQSICDIKGVDLQLAQGKCDLTPRSLLSWGSGLDWQEKYSDKPGSSLKVLFRHSNVLQMLYGAGKRDVLSYLFSIPAASPPNTTYRYSSGDTVLAMGLLKGVYGEKYADFLWDRIFNLIGAEISIGRDPQGVFIMSSNGMATARDLARFALLYAREGRWRNFQILPPGWLETTRTVAPGFVQAATDDRKVPGLSFWINKANPVRVARNDERVRKWPAAPEDMIAGIGHWEQFMGIIPSMDIVIIRFGDTISKDFENDEFVAHVLKFAAEVKNEK